MSERIGGRIKNGIEACPYCTGARHPRRMGNRTHIWLQCRKCGRNGPRIFRNEEAALCAVWDAWAAGIRDKHNPKLLDAGEVEEGQANPAMDPNNWPGWLNPEQAAEAKRMHDDLKSMIFGADKGKTLEQLFREEIRGFVERRFG